MKRQEIEIEPFKEWLGDSEKMYASEGRRKSITCTLDGTIKIYHNGTVIWSGSDVYEAIDQYNYI